MGYVVTARWIAKEGEEDEVLAALKALTPLSRAEPGCRFYQPNRDPENARVFFMYEIYDDEASYNAHAESPHFARYGLGDAIPRLEGRERSYYETIGE